MNRTAVAALGLSGPEQVGEAERARMFWSRVRAEETLRAPAWTCPRSPGGCCTWTRPPR
ncbi:hypothetical protein NKH77_28895 [Streptomyces sp. M19]